MTKKKNPKNQQVNKAAIRLIHADGFFPPGEADACWGIVNGLKFVEKEYGSEVENFSMILVDIAPIFSKMLGEEVEVDRATSGVFRRPHNYAIHFESFEGLNEWCFVIALEKTTFNIYNHVTDIRSKEPSVVDATSALEGWKFNYRNFFEWDVVTNVILEANQGVFFRPWLFHTFEHGIVQYYRLVPKGTAEHKKTLNTSEVDTQTKDTE